MSTSHMPDSDTTASAASAQASPRVLIVADDLTGGNACGALFAEAGLRTITVTDTSPAGSIDLSGLLDEFDAVVVNTDSRHLPPRQASELYTELIDSAGAVDLVACRIDTTLRGNVGPAAAAALSARRRGLTASGGPQHRVLGLCMPAFPAAGRTTVQGRQLLGGRLLEHTELAHDVRSPMRTSVIDEILAVGTDLDCRLIDIATVLAGREAVRTAVLDALGEGAEVIIADALTTDHIDLVGSVVAEISHDIAEATDPDVRNRAGLAAGEQLDWVTIDPGPGSLSLALSQLPTPADGVLLGISGSATEVTRSQLAAAAEDPTITILRPPLDDAGLPDVQATLGLIERAASARAIIIATVLETSDLRELTDAESELTTRRLALIASAVMSAMPISGLYTTGGDVTATVMRELGALGMEIDKEIVPLAVGGRLVGGRADGLPIVTKGGLIGAAGTAVECLEFLSTTARVRRN
ncbi:four-carbon acid sugar kinase family protein [Brevibacterium sp. CFH 10365]|uniref:four-carbon acid sugar kinase family protein n=1 Tax=Brevibacterium sp. CFH 10365 TaxID=2585207 RepID=UPI001D0D4032|nr:four-carbon acid sugar kinase family protein [Brevibacterium sp. CFH 10365]